MAIDTENRRRSVIGVRTRGRWGRNLMPVPDGVIDAGDRRALAGLYNYDFSGTVILTEGVRPRLKIRVRIGEP